MSLGHSRSKATHRNQHIGAKPTVIAVAQPSGGNASSGVIAFEFVVFARSQRTVRHFVRFVVAVIGAIASPRGRDARAAVTRPLIIGARVVTIFLVTLIQAI